MHELQACNQGATPAWARHDLQASYLHTTAARAWLAGVRGQGYPDDTSLALARETYWDSSLRGRPLAVNAHHSAVAAAEARAAQAAMQRTRWEKGMACIARAQGMARAATVRPLRVSVRLVDEEEGRPFGSTSVDDIAPTVRPSCGLAACAGTSLSGLVSGLASERDMVDTVGHQGRSAPLVRAEEIPGAGLTLR
jgi:hypothetical protein